MTSTHHSLPITLPLTSFYLLYFLFVGAFVLTLFYVCHTQVFHTSFTFFVDIVFLSFCPFTLLIRDRLTIEAAIHHLSDYL